MEKNIRKSSSVLIKYQTSLFIAFMLVVATFLIYWQVTGFEFINFDDDVYVTANPHIQKGISVENIRWAFSTTYANFWHPLTWLSFMFDYQFFGLKPGMFHLSNLFFHLLNSVLLFFVFKAMTKKIWQSALVAVLFALHPLHVESVAWISQRKDALSTLFWMLTMGGYFLYTKKPTASRYVLPILFYVMGLMAKPMLVTLPFVLLLLDLWPLGRFAFEPSSEKNIFSANIDLIIEKLPYFIITIIFSAITFYAQRDSAATQAFTTFPLATRIANAFVSYIVYIKKTIFPFDLTLHYPLLGAPPAWQVIGSILLLIGVSTFAALKAKKIPYFAFGWFWFLGTLVPVIGIVQIGLHAMADRYTYISLIGLFVIIVWGGSDFFNKWRYRNLVLTTLTVSMLCFIMVTSWTQIGYWRNSITVFEHAIRVTSRNYVAHNNLANAYVSRERADEAIYHYEEAIRLNPGDAQALNNLGFALAKTGRIDGAIEKYSKALELFPDYSLARYNLGDALLEKGDIDGFILQYTTVLGIKSDSYRAYKTLGDILFKKEKITEAITLYNKALKLNPNSEQTHTNLGIALFRQGKLDDAVFHFKKAVAINPNNPKTQMNLERILAIREKMKDRN